MEVRKTSSIGVDGEYRARGVCAAALSRPIEGVARENQSSPRPCSVAVGKIYGPRNKVIMVIITRACRKTMEVRKTSSIGVDGEYRARAVCAALCGRPIEGVARENQTAPRTRSVAAGETVQNRKIGAVNLEGKHRASAIGAALVRRAIQGVA